MNIYRLTTERRIGHQAPVQWDIGLDAVNHHFLERSVHSAQGLFSGLTVRDHLGDHRIVERWHGVVIEDMGVDANAGAARLVVLGDCSGGRQKCVGVFSVDTTFDRVTDEPDIILGVLQGFPRSDLYLLADDVDTRNEFGNRVFDLNSGIHLDKEKLTVLVEEFKRAGTSVTHSAAGLVQHSHMRERVSGSMPGAGASSRIFW
ncbi:MAG: hypothetical protein Ct9H300mP16_19990 [Pseudomonadota bacterium]|nr:MAG: hypothetical protein Ct9H300mP16_19990 [Pseudomonadota bacterium]